MNRDAQDNLTLLVGATMLVVGLTDLHLRYVKPSMQPLIVLSGLVLVAFGVRGVLRVLGEVRGRRALEAAEAHAHAADDPHGDHGPTRTAWLLALPLLVLSLVAPPSLGAYAAARSDTTIAEPTVDLPPLPPPTDGAVDLTLTDYYSRVLYDAPSLAGARVRLTGFATPVDGRWFVTRMALACCAADGRPVKVLTTGAPATPVPEADTWVEVVGRYVEPEQLPGADGSVATLQLESLRVVDPPRDQYE